MKKLTLILLLLVSIAHAQPNINQMEYFIGTDPGFGMANSVTGLSSQPNITQFLYSITANLNPGINYIGFRSKDDNNVWSHTNFLTWHVIDSTKSKITEVEYFWDVDSGFDSHSDTILASPIADIPNGTIYAEVPLSLSIGTHILFVRSKDTMGRWSHTNYVDTVDIISATPELLATLGITVYPNPFTDHINISHEKNESLRLMLYDIEGRKIIDKQVNQIQSINTANLIAGVYMICLWTSDKKLYRTTIVKQ